MPSALEMVGNVKCSRWTNGMGLNAGIHINNQLDSHVILAATQIKGTEAPCATNCDLVQFRVRSAAVGARTQ